LVTIYHHTSKDPFFGLGVICPVSSAFNIESIVRQFAARKRATGYQLPTGSDFKTVASIRLFFSPIIGREPLIAAMNEIYGGRLPFLKALYTDTATQDALASSAYADLRTAIVTLSVVLLSRR
jgi:hypothetical protein